MHRSTRFPLPAALVLSALSACQDRTTPQDNRVTGQTDFTTIERGSGHPGSSAGGTGGSAGGAPAPAYTPPPAVSPTTDRAPAGRVASVEEADVYKLSGTHLFYLNTYRGFLVYDIRDAKHPVNVSRLPVYGYPVEMFVEGNVVYALLRDALYLTETEGKLQFQRHNVSQLVSIDISDPAAPRVIKTMDIIGQLHEGVSRKIDKTIYVVSERFGGYSWGWPTVDANQEEQAWVYSYDVSNPADPRQVGQLQIFAGGNRDPNATRGNGGSRWFSGVAISATANALMVTENWHSFEPDSRCGNASQRAVVSIIDVSDPAGNIKRHTRFETEGGLDDQFKMTYRADEATGRGTFFGIFARQEWNGCGSGFFTRNTLESWDVTNGASPRRLASLAFGKENETVRATAYDLQRNVVYAITARQIDPLYAISIEDPAAPRVLSAIDGLSGSVSVFRAVGDGQFLLGVGQDQSDSCSGVQDGNPNWLNSKMAVSIIDVRKLDAIRLVQRKCVSIESAGGSWSSLTWNMDQAHKMLGMFQDGGLNVLTIPVSYPAKRDADVGWWWRWETAVGLLTWDLSRYVEGKPAPEQTVVSSYGAFVHPEGEVTRSILFRHPVTNERTMINVSDTHLSMANIQDLAHPRLDSIVEVAPAVSEIHRFGNHIVERVDVGQARWSPQGMAEFRVKTMGGSLNEKAPVSTFRVGQANAVYRFQDNLVVLRRVTESDSPAARTEAVIYGLADPAHPRLLGRIEVPFESYNYYGFFCGMGMGYWFGDGERTIVTRSGLAQVRYNYQNLGPTRQALKLAFLDLRDLTHPAVREADLEIDSWGGVSLVADPATDGFYFTHRKAVEEVRDEMGNAFSRFRYFAQRWQPGASGLMAGGDINLPGTLARTWAGAGGTRRFLTHDTVYRTVQLGDRYEVHGDSRLNLLRQVDDKAELLDARTFNDLRLGSLLLENSRLFVGAQKQWWGWGVASNSTPPGWEDTSDRLLIMDLQSGSLRPLYDQPTRTYGVSLMGLHDGNLFLHLPGDGVLVTDVSDLQHPRGIKFLRTLGHATHIEFSGQETYIASGNFGVFNFDLRAPSDIPIQ